VQALTTHYIRVKKIKNLSSIFDLGVIENTALSEEDKA
jgi:hypothetical protein